MIFHYICNKCLEDLSNKSLDDLSFDEYMKFSCQLAVEVEHEIGATANLVCEKHKCNLSRITNIDSSYIRGYGYLDKSGVKNDMNLHQMVSGADPYKSHRQAGDSRDLIDKLRRNTKHNPRSRRVFMK